MLDEMLDVVKNYVKQKTLCNSVDFYSSEIDADRIAAGHGFEDEREGIPLHRLVEEGACRSKNLVINGGRQPTQTNSKSAGTVPRRHGRRSLKFRLLRDKCSDVKKSDCCFPVFSFST